MSLTKTSVRALAASIAIVASGATFAGAAVFHLPILGFGRADSASAAGNSTVATTPPTTVKARVHKVRPKVVVKTRVVTDIVHRPSPVRVSVSRSWTPPAPVAPAPTLPVPVMATVPAATVPATAPARHEPEVADEQHHESEHDETEGADEHEAAAAAASGTATTTTVDR